MDTKTLKTILHHLIDAHKETEYVEFKEAKTGFDPRKLGKYFSALSNEANLKDKPWAWLVFGIRDSDRRIVDTQFRPNATKLDGLKHEIANETNSRITFIDIHELILPEGRVIMFQIPAASQGVPTSWKGHYYGREGESINALSLHEFEQIRAQVKHYDWSAQTCPDATLDALDPQAILKARKEYKQKHPQKTNEIDRWDDFSFLNKAKLTRQGKITTTAIILLGTEQSEHFISPSIARMTWILKDTTNSEKDYEHFGPPFILSVDRLFAKVRNLRYRYLPGETLFPIEVNQYDPWVIREALHNCIAHQDYALCGKINVVENPAELIFTNVGSFIPGDIETVIKQDAPAEIYRNPFLAQAMVNLNMIDTIGSGIKKMFRTQMGRFFPLPDYDLTQREKVLLKIQGGVLNENYTQLLINNRDIGLSTVILLDKVQKATRLSREEHKHLKSKKLVEGRYPNIFVASHLAAATEEKAKYIKYRGFDDQHYKDMITAFIKKYGTATRKDIDELLLRHLPNALDAKQKRNKISNLLHAMSRKEKTIRNQGSKPRPKWALR